MKFKAGDLAMVDGGSDYRGVACIVLGPAATTVLNWYKVYMIEQQRTTYLRQYVLSPMNPQVSESEV